MKYILISILFIFACSSSSEENKKESVQLKDGACPKGNHTDEVIPIEYGYPSEEMFRQSDSGLIMLGGCEYEDDFPNYYCKKHQIRFK